MGQILSSIFDAMNFQHFLELLEIIHLTAFLKNAGNSLHQKS